MLVSQPMPHAVQVTVCLHYGGLSELLEGLGPGDSERLQQSSFLFIRPFGKVTKVYREKDGEQQQSEVEATVHKKGKKNKQSSSGSVQESEHWSSKAYFICFGPLLQKRTALL